MSGDLGGAYMGLQLLEREKAVYYGQIEDIRKKMAEAKANGDNEKLALLNRDLENMRNFQPDFAKARNISWKDNCSLRHAEM